MDEIARFIVTCLINNDKYEDIPDIKGAPLKVRVNNSKPVQGLRQNVMPRGEAGSSLEADASIRLSKINICCAVDGDVYSNQEGAIMNMVETMVMCLCSNASI